MSALLKLAVPANSFVLLGKGIPVAVSAIEAIEVGSGGTALVRTVSGKSYPTGIPREELLLQLFGLPSE